MRSVDRRCYALTGRRRVGSRRDPLTDVHLVSGFSDILAGFQVSGNLETWKPGNLYTNTKDLHNKMKKKKIKKNNQSKIRVPVHDGRHSGIQRKN
jgi:hypothetical protein